MCQLCSNRLCPILTHYLCISLLFVFVFIDSVSIPPRKGNIHIFTICIQYYISTYVFILNIKYHIEPFSSLLIRVHQNISSCFSTSSLLHNVRNNTDILNMVKWKLYSGRGIINVFQIWLIPNKLLSYSEFCWPVAGIGWTWCNSSVLYSIYPEFNLNSITVNRTSSASFPQRHVYFHLGTIFGFATSTAKVWPNLFLFGQSLGSFSW